MPHSSEMRLICCTFYTEHTHTHNLWIWYSEACCEGINEHTCIIGFLFWPLCYFKLPMLTLVVVSHAYFRFPLLGINTLYEILYFWYGTWKVQEICKMQTGWYEKGSSDVGKSTAMAVLLEPTPTSVHHKEQMDLKGEPRSCSPHLWKVGTIERGLY